MMKKRWLAGCVVAGLATLAGCGGGFFIDTNTTGTTSTTGNFVYAVNSTANTINEYTIASGALALVSGSPISATSGLAAASVAVSRVNTYVWVGGNGAISSYSIGSTGALTLVAAQAAAATANFSSLETSPDGQWLLGIDSQTFQIYVYKINTSTGALTLNQQQLYSVPGAGTGAPRMVRISPNGAFVGVALGAGGDILLAFNTTNGTLAALNGAITPSGNTDTSIAFDGTSGFMYVSRVGASSGTSTIQSFTLSANPGLTALASTTTGNAPQGMLLDYTAAYLYSANSGAPSISGFKVGAPAAGNSAGTITALPSSPFGAGPSPTLLVEDKTHAYVVATGSAGGADVTFYKFDLLTAGNLDAVGTLSSGSAGIVGLAATH